VFHTTLRWHGKVRGDTLIVSDMMPQASHLVIVLTSDADWIGSPMESGLVWNCVVVSARLAEIHSRTSAERTAPIALLTRIDSESCCLVPGRSLHPSEWVWLALAFDAFLSTRVSSSACLPIGKMSFMAARLAPPKRLHPPSGLHFEMSFAFEWLSGARLD